MQSKNIGNFARSVIRTVIKNKTESQAVIDAIEKGYLPALDALIKGRFQEFWELLPASAQEEIFKLALSQFGKKDN